MSESSESRILLGDGARQVAEAIAETVRSVPWQLLEFRLRVERDGSLEMILKNELGQSAAVTPEMCVRSGEWVRSCRASSSVPWTDALVQVDRHGWFGVEFGYSQAEREQM